MTEKFYQLRARALGKDAGGLLAQAVYPGELPDDAKPPPSRDQIRAWLGNKLPNSDRCVDRLYEALADMCSSVPASKASPYDVGDRVLNHIQGLQKELPILIDISSKSWRGRAATYCFYQLLMFAEMATNYLQPSPPRRKNREWLGDAIVLLAILEGEVGAPVTVTSDKKVDRNYNNSGCQFILDTMAYVWPDIKLTGGNIERAIRDYRKKQW
jgi:hypothetical protein